MTPGPVTSPPARPRRRWRRWQAAVLIGGVLALAAVWLSAWLEDRDWRAACAEADRLDPDWRWEDLLAARPDPPDDRNIVLRVRSVHEALQRWPRWRDILRDEDLPALRAAAGLPSGGESASGEAGPGQGSAEERQRLGQYLESRLSEQDWSQRLRPGKALAVRRAVVAAAAALAQARGLEDLTEGRCPATYYQSPVLVNAPTEDYWRKARNVSYALTLRVILQTQDGQADAALDTCRACLRTARALNGLGLSDGLVMNALHAIAQGNVVRVLAQGEPRPESLAAAQRAVEEELGRPILLQALRGERALVEDFVRAIDEGRESPDRADELLGGVPGLTGYPRVDWWLFRLRGGVWSKAKAAAFVRYYTAVIEALKAGVNDPVEGAPALVAARGRLPSSILRLTVQIDKCLEADRLGRVLLRSAAAALAAERFRRDHGRWPAALAELVPAYLRAVPADPYAVQPLRLRRLADGLVIYSVGPDKTDDGGTSVFQNPYGMSKDIGFRLWDPANRGRPPPGP